jgi:hypothetical protein
MEMRIENEENSRLYLRKTEETMNFLKAPLYIGSP